MSSFNICLSHCLFLCFTIYLIIICNLKKNLFLVPFGVLTLRVPIHAGLFFTFNEFNMRETAIYASKNLINHYLLSYLPFCPSNRFVKCKSYLYFMKPLILCSHCLTSTLDLSMAVFLAMKSMSSSVRTDFPLMQPIRLTNPPPL